MKKIFIFISLVSMFSISAASAQSIGLDGTIRLNDGRTIVRIDVNTDNRQDIRSMSRRIRRLEQAVRALQNRVYELEDDAPRRAEVIIHTCTLPTTFSGTFIGKGRTNAEARANAVNACERGDGFPCHDGRIKSCETSVEYVNY